MARRKLSLELDAVVAHVGQRPTDATTERVLEAAARLLRERGLRGWTVEDVADLAGAGRTTVYRRFDGREELIHAVLAKELRDTFALIAAAASTSTDLEDLLVESALVALRALDGSLVEHLLQSDPATFLPFLTTRAGPLLAIARAHLTPYLGAELAEVAGRLGLSFVLTRETALPVGDEAALRDSVRRLLVPFVPFARYG